MTVALVRLDDRLIHGQVVIGWAQPMGARRIALVDDQVYDNAWEQDIYRLGVPEDVEVEFVSVEQAIERFAEWDGANERVIVLVGDVATTARLCGGARVAELNIGGVHHAEGRRERLAYVYLTDDEANLLKRLAEAGIAIRAQAVPSSRAVPLEELL